MFRIRFSTNSPNRQLHRQQVSSRLVEGLGYRYRQSDQRHPCGQGYQSYPTGIGSGSRLLAGGRRRGQISDPAFVEPTILTAVRDEMPVSREETFGPVITLYRVQNAEEAIRCANDSSLGLNASVWAGKKGRSTRIPRVRSKPDCGNQLDASYLQQLRCAHGRNQAEWHRPQARRTGDPSVHAGAKHRQQYRCGRAIPCCIGSGTTGWREGLSRRSNYGGVFPGSDECGAESEWNLGTEKNPV